jgi:hypothetical protein
VLVTFPRDTVPCMLERMVAVPAQRPVLHLEIGNLKYRPWRLQVFVDDTNLKTQVVGAEKTVDMGLVPPTRRMLRPPGLRWTWTFPGTPGRPSD